jgi:apolipoprotein N-acyltransferase
MASKSRHIGIALVAILATALPVYFGTGLHPWWPLLWFAPLPILLLAQRASWWVSALGAFFGWSLGMLNLLHYFAVLHVPARVQVVIFVTLPLLFMVAVLLFRSLMKRGAHWSALFAFPAVYTSLEYLLNLTSPHGTAGSLAYSQLNFLPFLQLASITGPWGMTFFLLLFSSAAAIFVHLCRTDPRRATRLLMAAWSAIAAVLVFGAVRLAIPAPPQTVRVGLVASDSYDGSEVADEGSPTEALLQRYAAQAEALAARGAQVIVLPEKIGVILDTEKSRDDTILQSVVDRTKAVIVVGVIEVASPVSYNQARVYTPGEPTQTYDKHHMLPPFELRFKPGSTMTFLHRRSGIWGVAICKDMDFTALSRDYGRHGAGLMLVPAWDFVLDRWSHGHIAIMRGVEDGFSIARAARDGYLTASDNRGRVLAETQSNSAPFATLLANIPSTHDETVYQLLGDWFAWVAMLITVLCSMQLSVRKKHEVKNSLASSVLP